MKIVVESHIPYIKGLLEPYAQVLYLETAQIDAEALRDADVFITRTRTRCDEALLAQSRVRFIGTATIGTDHIDLPYCSQAGIKVVNAPGCNAPAVAQWVLSTIGHWMAKEGIASPEGLALGVVGVGHVGSIVARWAEQMGFNVLLCDPPRAQKEGPEAFSTIEEVKAKSHIATFHTPLYREGDLATYHICDEQFLAEAPQLRLVMNAARGPICDNAALAAWHGDVAIDCWEHEPAINLQLLEKAFVATPHIAGYSADGKRRGTAMVVEALNAHYGWQAKPLAAEAPYGGLPIATLQQVMASYNPLADTALLKSNPAPTHFEHLRNHYDLRPEVL
ncbi:MAG: 4-phosphoerythronate dehydrogenase [Bacteroidales bacterium]|nr:4-phosphoerythronate dehydrogenase [Bacteroidales bacterium]